MSLSDTAWEWNKGKQRLACLELKGMFVTKCVFNRPVYTPSVRFTHSRQHGVSGCHPDDLEQSAGRRRIFRIALHLLSPTENFSV